MTVLFVYGTLKRGFLLHHHLGGARRIGVATTAPRYALFRHGWFPCLVEVGRGEVAVGDAGGDSVVGEVYALDGPTLAAVDAVETAASDSFVRRPIALDRVVRDADGGADGPDPIVAEAYFWVGPIEGLARTTPEWTGRRT